MIDHNTMLQWLEELEFPYENGYVLYEKFSLAGGGSGNRIREIFVKDGVIMLANDMWGAADPYYRISSKKDLLKVLQIT